MNRMTDLKILLAIVLASAVYVGASCGEDAPPKESAKTPMDETPRVDATGVQDLRTRVDQVIIVTGEVDRVGKSSAGHRFINLTGNGELTIFIGADDVAKFKEGTPESLFEGKTIAVRGKLERFRDKLQIQVRDPAMITLVEKKRGPPAEKSVEPIELKSVGRDTWESPAGLRYVGRDPAGLTRREHILRHAKDVPNRNGPHGVFDGGEELAFAWIDAAWKKIEQDKLKPEVEQDRVTYTVPMGQKVGYLGGKTGAERGHPPLKRIFIVLRKGTTDVITAFPK